MTKQVAIVPYGIKWNGPREPIGTPMDDGYWTPWHIANAEVERLRALLAEPNYCARCGANENEPLQQLDAGKTKLAIVMLDRFRDGRLQTANGTHTSILGPRDQLLEEADWFDHAAKVLRASLKSSEQCPGCVAAWPRPNGSPWLHLSPQGERLCEDIDAINSASLRTFE